MSDIFADYSFGGWLKRFRLKRQITLREMSRRIGQDSGNYCKIERSERSPPDNIESVKNYAKVLELTTSEFEMLKTAAFNFHFRKFKEKWIEEKGPR